MSRYNGSIKHLTKNCEACTSFATGERLMRFRSLICNDLSDDTVGVCLWGVAWKQLTPTEKPRKCEFRDVPPKGDHVAFMARMELKLDMTRIYLGASCIAKEKV